MQARVCRCLSHGCTIERTCMAALLMQPNFFYTLAGVTVSMRRRSLSGERRRGNRREVEVLTGVGGGQDLDRTCV